LRRALRGVSQGARGHAQAALPRDDAGAAAAAGPQAGPGREGSRRAAAAAARGRAGEGQVRAPLLVLAAALAALLLFLSIYTLGETEQAILTQFGAPVGQTGRTPGLHVKLPFVQVVHRFDKRWLEFDGDPNQIPTKDKKYIWVETYARWRIL